MATQEQLFELLKSEQVESQYNEAVPLSEIIPPEDGLPPSEKLIQSVRDEGVIEPLLLNRINNRYKIISGRRRYRAAETTERESVPAVITRVSPAKRAVLTIKLNNLRADNFLADVDALQVLIDKKFDEKQIDELTGLLPQERERRMRLQLADKRLVEALRAGRASLSLAETIAKLPPTQQARVLDKLNEKERLRMSDVHEVKEARTRAAVAALPQGLFNHGVFPSATLNGHGGADAGQVETDAGIATQETTGNQAERLLAVLCALRTSGALDFKNNKLSRAAIAEAKELLDEIGECNDKKNE